MRYTEEGYEMEDLHLEDFHTSGLKENGPEGKWQPSQATSLPIATSHIRGRDVTCPVTPEEQLCHFYSSG